MTEYTKSQNPKRDVFLSLVRSRMNPKLSGSDYDFHFNAVKLDRPDLLGAANAFASDQPRDEQGRWTDYGGGTSEVSSKAFLSATVPVRKRVSFGDQVAFMTGDKASVGVITGPDNGEGIEITHQDGTKIRRKLDKLRMPKNGFKVRDS